MSHSPRHKAGEDKASILPSPWSRALQTNASWPDKDELLDVVYWGRQVLGLIVGLLWGLVPFHGLLAILLYLAVSSLLGYLWVVRLQGQDEEEVGGFWELSKEGAASGFATFLVAWIITYSALHAIAPEEVF